jgi:ATP-dependent DNA helicase RecG
MATLDDKLGPVLGKRTADALEKAFGMHTVRDLLTHYPRRLDDRGALTDIAHLRVDEHATVLARVKHVTESTYRPKHGGQGRRLAKRTEVVVTDGRVDLTATFFNQPWRAGSLRPGVVAFFSGKVGAFRGRKQLASPVFEVLGSGHDIDDIETDDLQRFWPIYPATAQVSSRKLMSCVESALAVLDPVPDPLPDAVRRERGLLRYDEALRMVHQPPGPAEFERARARLRFDEAFVLQAVLAQRRSLASMLTAVPRPRREDGLAARFDGRLPFELTAGQVEVGEVIAGDLGREFPMQRLLQGEVGSGKTVVALRAMLQVVDAGGQAALLAPTEVLALQHHRAIVAMLGPLAEGGMLTGDDAGTRVVLLTGSTGAARRRETMLDIASGAAGIVVGTHALLEDKVSFAELGLVVVDEQHRFGVEQRAALTAKAGFTPPHVLVMTATPIPRTVAITVFGDLDISTLRELPVGRSPIQTTVVPADQASWVERVWQRVREEVAAGHQAYVVCPRIGGEPESAMEEAAPDESYQPRRPPLAVADVAASLVDGPLRDLRVYVLHGRMPADEKDHVMRRFAAGEIDVLVSTTVIEVGVDVPNATVMVLMDADRFGVSSLHQLRGRVGRGSAPGLCLLMTEAPADSPSRERLEAVAATTDGFRLSQLDLETRREGDVLGATQSGRQSSLKLLSVVRDIDVIEAARTAADAVVAVDPLLDRHPVLAAEVRRMMSDEQAGYLEKS